MGLSHKILTVENLTDEQLNKAAQGDFSGFSDEEIEALSNPPSEPPKFTQMGTPEQTMAMGNAALNRLLFGHLPQIKAGAKSLFSGKDVGEAYPEQLKQERLAEAQQKQKYPYEDMLGQGVGTMAQMALPIGGTAKTFLGGIAEGAAIGGGTAFAEYPGEQKTWQENLQRRIENIPIGATAGGALGLGAGLTKHMGAKLGGIQKHTDTYSKYPKQVEKRIKLEGSDQGKIDAAKFNESLLDNAQESWQNEMSQIWERVKNAGKGKVVNYNIDDIIKLNDDELTNLVNHYSIDTPNGKQISAEGLPEVTRRINEMRKYYINNMGARVAGHEIPAEPPQYALKQVQVGEEPVTSVSQNLVPPKDLNVQQIPMPTGKMKYQPAGDRIKQEVYNIEQSPQLKRRQVYGVTEEGALKKAENINELGAGDTPTPFPEEPFDQMVTKQPSKVEQVEMVNKLKKSNAPYTPIELRPEFQEVPVQFTTKPSIEESITTSMRPKMEDKSVLLNPERRTKSLSEIEEEIKALRPPETAEDYRYMTEEMYPLDKLIGKSRTPSNIKDLKPEQIGILLKSNKPELQAIGRQAQIEQTVGDVPTSKIEGIGRIGRSAYRAGENINKLAIPAGEYSIKLSDTLRKK